MANFYVRYNRLIFWIGAFVIFSRVLNYFNSVEDFGDILAMKLLSMMVITFFALLLFSNIINSLSHLYLSRDLPCFIHCRFHPRYFSFEMDKRRV